MTLSRRNASQVPNRRACIDDSRYQPFMPPVDAVHYGGTAGCLGDVTDALYAFATWNSTDWTTMRFGPPSDEVEPQVNPWATADDDDRRRRGRDELELAEGEGDDQTDDAEVGETTLFAVIGVDHRRTGKATYVNVDLNVITVRLAPRTRFRGGGGGGADTSARAAAALSAAACADETSADATQPLGIR